MSAPLAGIRVVDFTRVLSGPIVGRLLSDLGADVIKVEPPARPGCEGGDPLRKWRKLHPDDPSGTSLWWFVQARNKRSITIDMRVPEGQAIVRALAARSDIVLENFKAGTLAKFGLDHDSLKAINPEIGRAHV